MSLTKLNYLQIGDSGKTRLASGSAAAVLTSNPALGNSVIMAVSAGGVLNDITSLTSTFGTFTRLTAVYAGGFTDSLELWLCTNVTAAGNSVTVTDASGHTWRAVCYELPGTVVASNVSNASATSTTLTGTLTPSEPGDFMAFFTWNAAAVTAVPSGSWTNLNPGGWTLANGCVTSWQNAPDTTNISANCQLGSSTFMEQVWCSLTQVAVPAPVIARQAVQRASTR